MGAVVLGDNELWHSCAGREGSLLARLAVVEPV